MLSITDKVWKGSSSYQLRTVTLKKKICVEKSPLPCPSQCKYVPDARTLRMRHCRLRINSFLPGITGGAVTGSSSVSSLMIHQCDSQENHFLLKRKQLYKSPIVLQKTKSDQRASSLVSHTILTFAKKLNSLIVEFRHLAD